MHSQAIAGFLVAWVVAYVGIAGHCLSARLRSAKEIDYTVFGFLVLSLAVMNGGCAALHVVKGMQQTRVALTVADVGRAGAMAMLVHAALQEALITPKRTHLFALYGTAFGLAAMAMMGLYHSFDDVHLEPLRVLGILVLEAHVPPAPLGQLFSWISVLCALFAVVLFARFWRSGRRPGGLAAFIGALTLLSAVLCDAVLSITGYSTPLVTPYGYSAFAMGMVMSLLSRYSALRNALEVRAVELKQRSRELAQSYEQLREAQSEIVRKEQLAAVGELSAVIAHEVRNPLAILTSAVATLRRPGLPEEDRQTLLGILDEESSRLNRLVGDLLRYARPVRIERQWISPREILEWGTAISGARKDVVTELVEDTAVLRIQADPMLLRQVVENLINNALQAMPKGGNLVLRLLPMTLDGVSGVVLQIEDTGEGMDALVKKRALDPFFTTRASGTGLGLAIVARIVDAHGGQLRISSAAGKGTVVNVFLPLGNSIPPPRPSDPGRRSSLPPLPVELRKAMGRMRQ